jgi:K+-transporting ATPase ATPase B chain
MSEKSSAKPASEKQYALYQRAVIDAFLKLDPRTLYHNVVMFTVEIGSVITTLLFFQSLMGQGEASPGFIGAITSLPTLQKPSPRAGEKPKRKPCER